MSKILPELEGRDDAWLTADGEWNFDAIEKSALYEPNGFGTPDSKLTAHEQFLVWKRMIQEELFQSQDEYYNIVLTYSSFEQVQQHLDSLCLSRQV